jgi:hypothetical protein
MLSLIVNASLIVIQSEEKDLVCHAEMLSATKHDNITGYKNPYPTMQTIQNML